MKKVFVTGASSGIGLAISQALTRGGHEVWGTSRKPEQLTPAERFHPVGLDLRDMNGIDTTFDRAWSEAGHFDVLINNAGSGHFGPAESLSGHEIADQFQILFFSHIRLMQRALTKMQSRNAGLIVNVSSLAGRLPVPFMAAYNAGKAALSSFTMTMQLELARSGVHLVDLQPADIRTHFNEAINKKPENQQYAGNVAQTWKLVDHNMQTAPGPEIVAQAILALLDQANPPPRVTVGNFFQARIAPFIFRFLPQRLGLWGLKKYYRL